MSGKIQRMFDIKRTQLELVRDRGYDITRESTFLNCNVEEFYIYFKRQSEQQKVPIWTLLSADYYTTDDNPKRMVAFYATKIKPDGKKIPISVIKLFVDQITRFSCHEAILIIDQPLSSSSAKTLQAVTDVKWQVFYDTDLTYSPIKHVDVPVHRLLSPEEAEAKLREMKTQATHVPYIKVTDPVIRYYNWPIGGLVKIERDDFSVSILSPKSINYRLIIG